VHYEQALRIKPDHAEAQNHIGNILLRLGRVQEAIAHYEQALRISLNTFKRRIALLGYWQQTAMISCASRRRLFQLAEHACSLTNGGSKSSGHFGGSLCRDWQIRRRDSHCSGSA